MKTKIINTSKAEILVCELPEEIEKTQVVETLRGNVLISADDEDKDKWGEFSNPRYVNDIPEGNWQSLSFDEETARKIVEEYNDVFRDYSDIDRDDVFRYHTALESLQSLINKEVFQDNPYGLEPRYMFDVNTNPNDIKAKGYFELWKQAEESVFKNPHFFYKLKN